MNNKLSIKRLCIIGVGLIGGSLARALRRAGVVEHIIGVGRSRKNLEAALKLGVVDEITRDIGEGVRNADIVIVAVPMGMYESVFRTISKHIRDNTIISDVGSTKQHALDVAQQYLASPENFVPAHPIAGTEKSGVEASFPELFESHVCLLTPLASTRASAVDAVSEMWSKAGSSVIEMDPVIHDKVIASVSHLPHIAAFALVNAVCKQRDGEYNPLAFAAGGFRDFTRIASSSPEMWRDIAMSNRQPLLQQITALKDELSCLENALENQDAQTLLDKFAAAKNARDQWLEKHGDNF